MCSLTYEKMKNKVFKVWFNVMIYSNLARNTDSD